MGQAGNFDDGFRGLQGVGHGLRRQDDQRTVDPRILDNRCQSVFIAILGRIPDHIHGIMDIGRRRQVAGQHLDRLRCQLRQLKAGGHGHVRGHDARSPGIGDNGHAVAVGNATRHLAHRAFRFKRKGIGKIEEFIDGIHPDHAGLLENGIIDRFGPGQGARVGRRRLRAGRSPARFDHQNRRGAITRGNVFHHLNELRPPPQLFEVEHDHVRVHVLMQILEEVQFIHIGLVADRNEFRKPEIPGRGKIQNGRTERTTLGNKRYVARAGHTGRKAGIQPHGSMRIDDAQAVGAHHAHARFAAHGHQAILDRAPLGPDFTETGGHDHDPLHPFSNGLFDGTHRAIGGQDDHRQIDAVGNFGDGSIRPHAEHRLGGGVDRIEDALVAAPQDIGKNIMPHLAGSGRCTDHRHRVRRKNSLNFFHYQLLGKF